MLLLCLFRRDGEKKNYHGKERTKERKKGGGARKISKDERTQAGRNPGSCTSPERGILPFRSTQPSRRTGSLIKKNIRSVAGFFMGRAGFVAENGVVRVLLWRSFRAVE